MWNIKSATESLRIKACKELMNQYVILTSKKVKALADIKKHTFDNTCYLLARYYKVKVPLYTSFISMWQFALYDTTVEYCHSSQWSGHRQNHIYSILPSNEIWSSMAKNRPYVDNWSRRIWSFRCFEIHEYSILSKEWETMCFLF